MREHIHGEKTIPEENAFIQAWAVVHPSSGITYANMDLYKKFE